MSGATVAIAFFVCAAATIICGARYFYLGRTRKAAVELTAGKELRALTEEYRRLSDMAITTNEHVDLRLTGLSVRVDELRDQLDQLQRILKEVE